MKINLNEVKLKKRYSNNNNCFVASYNFLNFSLYRGRSIKGSKFGRETEKFHESKCCAAVLSSLPSR